MLNWFTSLTQHCYSSENEGVFSALLLESPHNEHHKLYHSSCLEDDRDHPYLSAIGLIN